MADGLSKLGIAFSSEVPSACFWLLFSEDVYEFRLRPDREEIYMVKNVQGAGAVVNCRSI